MYTAAKLGLTLLFMAVVSICNASEEESDKKSPRSPNGFDRAFTYSLITASEDRTAVLKRIQSDVVPAMKKKGAALYSIWIPREESLDELPERGNFKGLLKSQLGLMLAWPKEGLKAEKLDAALMSVEGVETAETRAYEPIYLVQTKDGFGVPTGRGLYVQRKDQYLTKNVDEAVQLSKDAVSTSIVIA